MKIRTGFVSNSSSTSHLICGVILRQGNIPSAMLRRYIKKHNIPDLEVFVYNDEKYYYKVGINIIEDGNFKIDPEQSFKGIIEGTEEKLREIEEHFDIKTGKPDYLIVSRSYRPFDTLFDSTEEI
jgi:hypothetical protein